MWGTHLPWDTQDNPLRCPLLIQAGDSLLSHVAAITVGNFLTVSEIQEEDGRDLLMALGAAHCQLELSCL